MSGLTESPGFLKHWHEDPAPEVSAVSGTLVKVSALLFRQKLSAGLKYANLYPNLLRKKKTGKKTSRFLALEKDILDAISDQYSQNLTSEVVSALKEVSSGIPEISKAQSDFDKAEIIKEAPVANIVTQLLEYAVKTKASDIHVEPEETQTRVRYRIDGILHEKIIFPKKIH